jgi:hypothetical protein
MLPLLKYNLFNYEQKKWTEAELHIFAAPAPPNGAAPCGPGSAILIWILLLNFLL